MKREFLAATVAAACAAPALAQVPAEIQIYGRVNVSVEHISVKNSSDTTALPNQSHNELVDNASRIGFRGNKDLGGGLKAIWQVESLVKLDDSAGSTFASRDSWAGLAGDVGTLRLGRTNGPVYYATYDWISMHNHDSGTSSDNLLAPVVKGSGAQGRQDNSIWYTSPKLGGAFTVDLIYSMVGEQRVAAGMNEPQQVGAVGAYDSGPIHLAVSYTARKNTSDLDPGAGIQANKDDAITVGGSYDFRFMVLGALYEKAESDVFGGTAKRDYFRVAVKVPVEKHEFHFNYGWVDHRLDVQAEDDGAKQWTLFYNYNLTKETKVYAFYTAVDNDTNGAYGFRQVSPAVAGADFSSIGLGFRHNF
ncbi:MAG TPA: porin [Burkholderiales bacterium]